ncbi:hypothetical protein QFZ20_002232 [Flavobacterium sp. W4I14]|nr:hypothetical protein [Flavobacterium sp. W4I14]
MKKILILLFVTLNHAVVLAQTTNKFPESGNVGIGTLNPSAKLSIALGAGAANGTVGLKIGSVDDYPSLELGVENNYDAQIRTFGNDLNIYAGHFRTIGSTSTEDHEINFYTSKNGSTNWNTVKMVLTADGQLGIGTITPSEKLSVNGNIRAREIKVEAANWPDYVFARDYRPLSPDELERYISVNKHLPGLPSAKEAEENGIELGKMNKKLLEKIEELTLYMISQQKEIKALTEQIYKK